MKSVMFVLSVLFLSGAAMAQSPKAEELLKFKETVHDFGKIKQGVPVTHDFQFTNVSNKPVVIESAIAACGCTTPTWPQTPVAKGKSETLKAGFNAAALGSFNKTITVKVAGVQEPMVLTIKGVVVHPSTFSDEAAKK